ncbi:hypothetical protein EV126DRAFT_104468 [Verticillium dahliae]|nr:hypothetical protein EV126DRAFT_104468 [Verticillium dahliae]
MSRTRLGAMCCLDIAVSCCGFGSHGQATFLSMPQRRPAQFPGPERMGRCSRGRPAQRHGSPSPPLSPRSRRDEQCGQKGFAWLFWAPLIFLFGSQLRVRVTVRVQAPCRRATGWPQAASTSRQGEGGRPELSPAARRTVPSRGGLDTGHWCRFPPVARPSFWSVVSLVSLGGTWLR